MDVTYDFSGERAVVTGGSRGIGRAIASGLVRAGAEVQVWDIEPLGLDGAKTIRVDVTSAADVSAAVQGLGGRVDILVNDAGYLGPYRPFEDFDGAEWTKIVSTNLLGVMNVTRALLPGMREGAGGRIVNLGSLAGKEGLPSLAAYSAASAGVIAFTKALSREVVEAGIRVNCVAPGPIDTRMIRGLGNEVVDAMISASPMGRLGDPEEVRASSSGSARRRAPSPPARYSTSRVGARGIERWRAGRRGGTVMSGAWPVYVFRTDSIRGTATWVTAAPAELVVAVYGGGGVLGSGGLDRAFGGSLVFVDEKTATRFLGIWGRRNGSRFRNWLRKSGTILTLIEEPPPGRLQVWGTIGSRPEGAGEPRPDVANTGRWPWVLH